MFLALKALFYNYRCLAACLWRPSYNAHQAYNQYMCGPVQVGQFQPWASYEPVVFHQSKRAYVVTAAGLCLAVTQSRHAVHPQNSAR